MPDEFAASIKDIHAFDVPNLFGRVGVADDRLVREEPTDDASGPIDIAHDWARPMVRLAEAFGVPVHTLRSLGLDAGVPLPSSGYWSWRRSGTAAPPPPLPPRPPGASAIITLGAYGTWWRRRSEMLSDPIPFDRQPLNLWASSTIEASEGRSMSVLAATTTFKGGGAVAELCRGAS
jgi:hypothetical protein